MKLYREVKTSERLPEKSDLPDGFCSDWVLAHWKEYDSWGWTMYDYDDDCWDALVPDIWLEPIEITYEEILDEILLESNRTQYHHDGSPIYMARLLGLKKAAKAILSKLKQDESK